MQQEYGYQVSASHDVGVPMGMMGAQSMLAFSDLEIDLSHELRTSLAIIMLISGNLDFLYDRLDEQERRKMIRNIRRHTQKMSELVDDLLQFCDENSLPVCRVDD